MELLLVLCLPRDAETAHVIRGVLDAAMTTLGVSGDTRADIGLALGEACANVIQHADASDEYEVRARIVDSRCVIEVVDTGRGFDAAALDQAHHDQVATAEHGRGLQIIQAVAENLQILNRRTHGAMLRFEVPLKWEPDSTGQNLATDAGTS